MALCVHDGFWHPQAPLYRVSDILFETANKMGSQLKAYESDVRFAEDGEEVLLADYVSEQFAALISASEQYMGMIDSISPSPAPIYSAPRTSADRLASSVRAAKPAKSSASTQRSSTCIAYLAAVAVLHLREQSIAVVPVHVRG